MASRGKGSTHGHNRGARGSGRQLQGAEPDCRTASIIGRTDADAETPVLWPPDAKS